MQNKRNISLESKVDACLILLQILVTSDEFEYTLSNKSPQWIRAMKEARAVASDVSILVADSRPECAEERLSNDYPSHDTFPNETAENAVLASCPSEAVQIANSSPQT